MLLHRTHVAKHTPAQQCVFLKWKHNTRSLHLVRKHSATHTKMRKLCSSLCCRALQQRCKLEDLWKKGATGGWWLEKQHLHGSRFYVQLSFIGFMVLIWSFWWPYVYSRSWGGFGSLFPFLWFFWSHLKGLFALTARSTLSFCMARFCPSFCAHAFFRFPSWCR